MSNAEILTASGFAPYTSPRWNFWINRDKRMAFSFEAMADCDSGWLERELTQSVPVTEFWFYFSIVPENARESCLEFLDVLRLPNLQPQLRPAPAGGP